MKISKSQLKQIIKEEMEKVLNEQREYTAAGTAFDTEANAIELFRREYPQYDQTQVVPRRDQKKTGVWYLWHPELAELGKIAKVRIAAVKFKSNVPGEPATNPTQGGKLPAVELLDDPRPDRGPPV